MRRSAAHARTLDAKYAAVARRLGAGMTRGLRGRVISMSNSGRLRIVALLVVVVVLLTQVGCDEKERAAHRATQDAQDSYSVDTPEEPTTAVAASDDPLAGTWTYEGMVMVGSGESATWRHGAKPGTLVIEKRSDGYFLQIGEGTSKATLDGANVLLERNFPKQGVSVRYSGVLSGDTITGTQHTTVDTATGKGSHDDPWTATRAK